jgi:hypothetical protein
VAFGRWCFYAYSHPEGSKISRIETWRQVEKTTGTAPAELRDAPIIDMEHLDAWHAYNELKDFSYPELESYMRLTGNPLHKWEIEAIMELAKYRNRPPIWPLNTQT